MQKDKLLIVDDSKSFVNLLSSKIKSEMGMNCLVANNFKETKDLVSKSSDEIFLALVDLNIYDSKDTEHIDYLIAEKVPVIVVTGDLNDDTREKLLNKSIIDYIYKARKEDLDYVTTLLKQIKRNSLTKVIVVDDSPLFRKITGDLLRLLQFHVIECKSGLECLELLETNEDIKMVLTDYSMKDMDGFELTIKLRQKYPKDNLIIISISGNETKNVSSKFLKVGADDFLTKPFSKEEFTCRINHNLDSLESLATIKDSANRDYLTGMYNRRYFMQKGSEALKEYLNTTLAIISLEDLKAINEKFGHSGGDAVLKNFAKALTNHFNGRNMIARLEGKRFVAITFDIQKNELERFYQSLCDSISEMEVHFEGERINYNISIAVNLRSTTNIDIMLKEADKLVSEARAKGKNGLVLR